MQIKINEITKKSNRESCYNKQGQCLSRTANTLYRRLCKASNFPVALLVCLWFPKIA